MKSQLLQRNEDPFLERKEFVFQHLNNKGKKDWYYQNYPKYKYRINQAHIIRSLKKPYLPIFLNFIRWILIDFVRGKPKKFWGIYQFVALPGEGKTMSMVAHIERVRKEFPSVLIATNFFYKYQEVHISHWMDMLEVAVQAKKEGRYCILALDEIHTTFDSSDWKSFPGAMLSLLSFNRKFSLQFLCTSQIYERIPKKIRDIANYTVICKNVWGADRMFRDYYFKKSDYESQFEGKKKKADFVRDFVADDDFYSLYDTLEQVEQMTADAKSEKDKQIEAFNILFGNNQDAEESE